MFLKILETLMNERDLNKSTLAKESGIPYTTIDGFWKKGCDNVKLSTLSKLSDYFNVSLDYLLGKEKTVADSSNSLNDAEQYLINGFRELSAQGQDYIIQTLNMALNTYKKAADTSGKRVNNVG